MERYQAQRVRMFRCLRCRRIGNSTASIAGCDCKNARHEEVWLVPEDQLRGAVLTRDQDIAALRDVLTPFLTLDRDLGDEWEDVCEAARRVHEATGGR